MKSHTFKIITILLLSGLVASCDRELETEGITTKITFFPVFELEGEEEMTVQAGEEFTLPGVVATEQGQEIPVTTSITGTYFESGVDEIDTSVPDIYNVTYSAINVDGFPGTATRTVKVLPPAGDLINSIEGVYTSTVGRDGPATEDYIDMEYVYIIKIADNTYQISDIIGGYYDLGRAYGPAYAGMGATITANNILLNDFSFSDPIGVGAFAGAAEMTEMQVNALAKTIKYKTTWVADPATTYLFDITLTQVP